MARWNKTSPEMAEKIKNAYENTSLTLQEIAATLGSSYKAVLGVVYASYSKEVQKARKVKNYRRSKIGDKNPMLGKMGALHHNYKGEVEDGRGYLMVLRPPWYTGRLHSKHVFVHHVVVCQHMGITQIPQGYHVHHCDKNTKNNNFDNLVLLRDGTHIALHQRMRREGATTISKESTLKWVEARDGKLVFKTLTDDIV